MKKLMEQMAEELSAAFEKSGYDPSYGKVTVSNRPDLCEFQCNHCSDCPGTAILFGRSCLNLYTVHHPDKI